MRSKWKYEVIICWSDEDQAYIAEVPELPGRAADGATYKDALANAAPTVRSSQGRCSGYGQARTDTPVLMRSHSPT